MSFEPAEATDKSVDVASSKDGPTPDYTAEIRFGVVMYGGVSLAIYINGVTNELFEMACATPRAGVGIQDVNEPFTREIYRRVSWLLGNEKLRERYAQTIRSAAFDAPRDGAAQYWSELEKHPLLDRDPLLEKLCEVSRSGAAEISRVNVFLSQATK